MAAPRLVLASASPQRRAILADLGLAFEVRATDVLEEDEGAPRVVASENALRKALAAVDAGADELVLGCDTLVATDPDPAESDAADPDATDPDAAGGAAPGFAIADRGATGGRGAGSGFAIWGKPPTEEAARATLRHLSGRTHEVVSGLALVRAGDVRAATEVTRVTFRTLDEDVIAWYLSTGEWRGRAGGYAIQGRGAALVKRIEGDYLNVVGLPVSALLDLEPALIRRFTTG